MTGTAHHSVSSKSSVFGLLDEAPMTPVRYLYWLLASGGTLLDGFSVVSLGIAVPLIERRLAVDALVMPHGFCPGAGGRAWRRRGGSDRPQTRLCGRHGDSCRRFCPLRNRARRLADRHRPIPDRGWNRNHFPTSSSYVSEIMPRALRSRMTIATIALQSVGMIAAALFAIAIFRAHPSTTDWRDLLWACGLLGLVFMAARTRLPESPRWLAEKGRLAEAAAVLSQLTRAPISLASVATAPKPGTSDKQSPEPLRIAALFGPRYRMRTLLVSLPWLMMDVATYGVALFTPVILRSMHFASGDAGTLASVLAEAEGSGTVDVFLLVGFIAGMWAVPRFGRIPMRVAGFAGMSFGMLLLMFAAMTRNGPGAHLGPVITRFVIFNFAMNASPNATTFTLAPVLFPTAIRASAGGFAAACAKIGATIGTFVVPQLQAAWGLIGVPALMAFVSIGGLVATAAFAHLMNEEDKMEETADDRPALVVSS